MPASLYDIDFVLWTCHNAGLLRSGNVAEADLEHIAEEIEEMGKSQAQQLESRIERILEHLLKLRLATGLLDTENEGGWRKTVREQRRGVARVLRGSPSLRPCVPAVIQEVYSEVAEDVRVEFRRHGFDPPAECPFSVEDVLGGEL